MAAYRLNSWKDKYDHFIFWLLYEHETLTFIWGLLYMYM